MSVKRVNSGGGHSYRDTETGAKIPGVTTICKALPKDALINWSATATAGYAIDNWDALSAKAPSVRLKELNGARYADRDRAANKGTQVHKLAEKLVTGAQVQVPEEIAGHVQSYVRFLDEFNVQPVLIEAVVVSYEHTYCGTLDLIADLTLWDDDLSDYAVERWLIDLKTSRSGVFGESALQLAPYRFADAYIDSDGVEQTVPEVDRTGVVHIRSDGYDLVPVEAGEAEFRQFLYVQQTSRWVDTSRELIGDPIIPPTTSTFRLARDE